MSADNLLSLRAQLFNEVKCPRTVRPHKCEKLLQNNQEWWENKFKEFEDNIRVPDHTKYSELKNIFTKDELRDLTAAGLIFDRDDYIEDKNYRKKLGIAKRRRTTYQSNIYIPVRRANLNVKKNVFADRILDFYKKTPEDAKVWSAKQKRQIDQSVHLIQRAAMVEEELAEDFDKWFSAIKTYSQSEIDKDTILKIFEINNSLPINNAISVNMKTMKSVPDSVAKYMNAPKLASSHAVKREINSDIKATKVVPRNIGFGTMLPKHLRKTSHITDNNIKISSDHKELETFGAVFRDIMDLETSRRFVSWLRDHPEVPAPPFIKKSYMDVNKRRPRRSFIIRQIYEAKVWSVGSRTGSTSSEKPFQQTSSSSLLLTDNLNSNSSSEVNFLI